ncbi:hypothetical protein F441_14069 [Phytophthora nicotianae CJ01A1]|uniref:Uncharacterized protein n=4 Tax=Phytophthora nicotianae TaxID=4792 RepID=V9ENK3_PHYNI|nr:hypothetical protein F443_14142 [Phytophthora nicotianae P1569]ETK80586.1 hypothetical protein L915_13785 [Phytophthora nicotianae]ETO69181.1 hypothetical protein F444_14172 [Phytophthora nicotianae P1976]ETP10252.1 hypothetical protein F441_14069 [Phytophthora nicotianae CJ01A1]ETL34009.1 hypothetical protein L916_13680 [Phytophthora nicotianae]
MPICGAHCRYETAFSTIKVKNFNHFQVSKASGRIHRLCTASFRSILVRPTGTNPIPRIEQRCKTRLGQ